MRPAAPPAASASAADTPAKASESVTDWPEGEPGGGDSHGEAVTEREGVGVLEPVVVAVDDAVPVAVEEPVAVAVPSDD